MIREVGAEQGALPLILTHTFLRSVTALSVTRPAYVPGQNAVGSEERFAAATQEVLRLTLESPIRWVRDQVIQSVGSPDLMSA